MDNIALLLGLGILLLLTLLFLSDLARLGHPRYKRKETDAALPAEKQAVEPIAQPAPAEPVIDDSVVATEQETQPEEIAPEQPAVEPTAAQEVPTPEIIPPEVEPAPEPELADTSWAGRIKAGLSRTRGSLSKGLGDLLLGKKQIDDDLLEDIESQLLIADVGMEATQQIIQQLTEQLGRNELKDSDTLFAALKTELGRVIAPCTEPLAIPEQPGPFVILVVGVNGVGKTTTIGKLAKRFQSQGKSVMLAAGDTFRAAAVEQLQAWGERNQVPVVAQDTGADSASVIYDALASAQAKQVDVLIADTAGRLQNKDNLMDELGKVKRVMAKLDAEAPHEVMLVLDAGTGQNAISQANLFDEAVGITGISLTKLDGTAKGGVIFAIAKQLVRPIRFIGVGEQIDDLRPFEADEFIEALFD